MKKQNCGFTLIEILISTSILAIVFTIAVYVYNNNKNYSQAYYAAARVRSDLIDVRNKVLTYEPSYSAGILNGTTSDSYGYKNYKYQDDLYNALPSEKTVNLNQYGSDIRISIPGGSCKFKKDTALDSSSNKTIFMKVKDVNYNSITVYVNGKIGEIVNLR